MTLTARSIESKLIDSAPAAGSGLNEWLAKGARMTSDLEPYKSFDMLAEIVQAKGGRRDDRAIWRAINKIRGKVGLTQEGKESGRCLSNVLHSRYLVTEFDFKPVRPDGVTPTIWAPLIELWKAHGMTVLDAQAALILFLMDRGPLAMVTF